MSHTFTHCPSTLSAPGVLRRCILPFLHNGDHFDEQGPWGLGLKLPSTGVYFGGRLAPHIAKIQTKPNVLGLDLVTFTCGHQREVSSEARDRLIEFGGHPVCLQCDGATPKPRSFDKCQAVQHGMAQHAAAADASDREKHWRQSSADLTTLAHGDRLGPDATLNARTVQDRLDAFVLTASAMTPEGRMLALKRLVVEAEQRGRRCGDVVRRGGALAAQVHVSEAQAAELQAHINRVLGLEPAGNTKPDATRFDALVQHVTTLEHKLRRLEERHWWADRKTLFAGTPCHCGRCRVRWTQPHSYSVVFSVRGMDKSALAEWVLGK